MKILLVSQYFWPENFRINTVAKLLVHNGADVTVLTGCPNYPYGVAFSGYKNYKKLVEIHPDGFEIYRVPIILRGNSSSIRLIMNYFSFILSAILFAPTFLKNKKFDIVFVYGLSPIFQVLVGIFIKNLRKIPLVSWVQDLWPESVKLTNHIRNKFILDRISNFVSWIYKKNDLLLVQSKGFIKIVEEQAGIVPVIYFPTPGELISDSNLVKVYQKPDFFLYSGFNIVFAGNLGVVQSLNTILEAAELLKDDLSIRIIFVGSGSQSHWLSNAVKYRNLGNVVLAGPYPSEQMPQIFNSASALLVSLISDPILNLTIPAKIQSYLAAGKPILASLDGEGAKIIIEAKAGLVCQSENSKALAESIIILKKMSNYQLEIMGNSGREYFEANFNPNKLVAKLLDILNQLVIDFSSKNEK
jgi:glycosyltransferase involved in cell wall biosynthesis